MQGRVRTKTVKRASRILIEKYYQKLTMDFDTNKRICDEVAEIQSKRLRNKIAGFTTVRRVQCKDMQLAPRDWPAPSAPFALLVPCQLCTTW